MFSIGCDPSTILETHKVLGTNIRTSAIAAGHSSCHASYTAINKFPTLLWFRAKPRGSKFDVPVSGLKSLTQPTVRFDSQGTILIPLIYR